MKIYSEKSLSNFEFWSGGKESADLLDSDQLDQVEAILEDLYPNGISDTELNDLFWFDFDEVKRWIGFEPEEDEED